MAECYLAKDLEILERRSMMAILFEKPVCRGSLVVDERHSKILPFLSFHAKKDPTIRVKMFITLEKCSNTSKFDVRMFITLERPSKACEGIFVLIKCNTLAKVVPGISCPMGIPPKPSDVVAVSIITTCSIHF